MSIVKGIFKSKSNLTESSGELCLDTIFKEFYDRLVYFSFQLVDDKHQAEDIVQDAFIKYWHLKEMVMPDKTAIKNFLYSTVRNASLNSIRHTKVVEGYIALQGSEEPEEPAVIEAIITAEVIAQVQSAIQSLPGHYRAVSVLGYLEGKNNHEIAEDLELSINTVKKQKQRALQLLRMKLTPEMFIVLFALISQVRR